jgi:hypothetical protein
MMVGRRREGPVNGGMIRKRIRIEYQKERVIVKAFASQALDQIRDVDISSKPSRVNPTAWMVWCGKERKGHLGHGTGVSRGKLERPAVPEIVDRVWRRKGASGPCQ